MAQIEPIGFMTCRERPGRCYGCCYGCARRHRADVKSGKTSWEKLAANGKARLPRRSKTWTKFIMKSAPLEYLTKKEFVDNRG